MLARRATIGDDDLAEIVEEMGSDGVWVHPAYAREQKITAADEARLEQLVAETDSMELRVVLVDIDYRDDRFQGNFSSLSAWVHDDLGGDAVYVGVEGGSTDQLALEPFGDAPDDLFYAGRLAAREHPEDVVAQVERFVELAEGDEDPYELWTAIPAEERYSQPGGDGADGGLPGGGIAAAVVLVAAAGAWWLWRRRRSTRRGRHEERFSLPPAVLRTVRAAEDRRLRHLAETETLALGEALGAESPVSGGEQTWRRALDHYDAARAVLERAGSPADVVGALVLTRRGDSARRTALAGGATGAAWQPPGTCYFNPLHTGAVRTVVWKDGERSVEVPACAECEPQVVRGQEPDDALDFIAQDTTVHYYRLDIGAWSDTGYGALEPDLIGALRAGRRRRGLRRRS